MGAFKKLLWAAVIGLVAYGGYAAYVAWWEGGGTDAPKSVGAVAERLGAAAGAGLQSAKTAAGTYTNKVVGEAQQSIVSSLVGKVGTAVLQPIGEQLASWGASLAGGAPAVNASTTVPAAQGSSFDVPPPPATIVARPGVPLSLSINRVSEYSVNWGDGAIEKGTTSEDHSTVLVHAWAGVGDYSVTADVKESGTEHSYVFPVRVLAP